MPGMTNNTTSPTVPISLNFNILIDLSDILVDIVTVPSRTTELQDQSIGRNSLGRSSPLFKAKE